MPRTRLIAAALGALLALGGPTAAALAADAVDVTGTVTTAEGAPSGGIEVLVGVDGTDIVQPTTTDGTGAFAVQVEAAVGDTISIRATGATVVTGPDEDGCLDSATPTGSASVTIEALPLEPIVVVLDTVISDRVCTATASPGPEDDLTPPPTDAAVRAGGDRGPGWLLLAMMVSTIVLAVALAPRRRPR